MYFYFCVISDCVGNGGKKNTQENHEQSRTGTLRWELREGGDSFNAAMTRSDRPILSFMVSGSSSRPISPQCPIPTRAGSRRNKFAAGSSISTRLVHDAHDPKNGKE